MAFNFDIAPLNPLKFYQLSDELIDFPDGLVSNNYNLFNPNYNYRQFDDDFYFRNIKSWDEKRLFFQPFQQGDFVRVQFLGLNDIASGPYVGNPYTAYLIDCNNKIVGTYSVTSPSVTLIDGQRIREVEIPLYNIPEGYYRVVLRRREIAVTSYREYVISEPIHVKQTHTNSVLMEYTNSKNAQGVIFEFGLTFQFRAYAMVGNLEMNSRLNAFEDEPLNMTVLSSTPFRLWTLTVGGEGNQVPDWFIDKIERITGCDSLLIDGKGYQRPEGVKLEINRKDGTPLSSCKIQLREAENDNNLYVEQYQFVYKMGTAYDTQYFYVRDISYGSGPITQQVRKIFAGRRQFLDYLNSVFKDAYSLGGSFGITPDGEYGYKPSSSSDATTFANITITDILPYGIKYDVACVGAENSLIIDLTHAGAKYAVEWGDGTSAYNTIAGTVTLTKNYTTDKNYSAIVCVDDLDDIDLTYAENIVKGIGGDLPPSLASFTLADNILRYINGSLFGYVGASFVSMDVSGNRLLTKSIDTIIKSMYDNGTLTGGAFVMDGQTPAASPSEQVYTILLPTLVAAGNTFTLD